MTAFKHEKLLIALTLLLLSVYFLTVITESSLFQPIKAGLIQEHIINRSNEADSKLININTSTKEELMNLKGVGPAKAQSIIEHRKTNGNFRSIEELIEVDGVGRKTFETNRHLIAV